MHTIDEEIALAAAAAPVAAPRFDMYAGIHKALRHAMTDTLVRLGRADLGDAAEREAAFAQLAGLLEACRTHLRHENDYIHTAIEARRPAGARRTSEDHAEHLEAIAALEAELATARAAASGAQAGLAHRLYHHVALFVAENFQHMHVEETANNAALWALYTDAELLEIHDRLVGSIPPGEMLDTLRWMVPALRPVERAMMLGGARPTMPPEAFLGVLAHVRPHLEAGGWPKLAGALGVAA